MNKRRKNPHAVALGRNGGFAKAANLKGDEAVRVDTAENPHAVALGRKGGKVGGLARSKAKTLAARLNGAKGGRPRKQPMQEGQE